MKTITGSLFLILGVLFLPAPSQAQKHHILELSSGISRVNSLNKLISPLRYSGTTLPIMIDYQIVKPKYKMIIGGQFSSQKLQSIITDGNYHLQNEIQAGIYFGYLRKINPLSSKKFSFYAGAYNDIFVSYENQMYNEGDDEKFLDISISLIQAALGFRLTLSPQDIISDNANITLLGLSLRTPYYGLRSEPDTYFELPDENLMIKHQISYAHYINRHFLIGLRYRFMYHKYNYPFKAYALANHYLLTFGVDL